MDNEKSADIDSLKPIASETLHVFEQIVAAATAALGTSPTQGVRALANVNTLTGVNAIREVERIGQVAREANYALVHQPAIARVVVVDQKGARATLYVTRAAVPSGLSPGFPKCASSRAPLGRLASLSVGGELTVGGKTLEVVERARLRPEKIAEEWDSKDTIFEAGAFGPITIESLRRLLAETPAKDLLGQLLAEESEAANVIAGIRRGVIMKMTLRDQPTLDEFQDEIFRLPLARRLVLLGPPGTGKTTTLVRRLGQKLDMQFLEDDKEIVEAISASSGMDHVANWVMFSPTHLLKQFLKEAFAVEGIPAPDLCVRTWNDHRRELGRETFGVLRTTTGGSFVLKEFVNTLRPDAISSPGAWFADFDGWQRKRFLEELTQAATSLATHADRDVAECGTKMSKLLSGAEANAIAFVLVSLAAESLAAQELLTRLKAETDGEISKRLNLELNRNPSFVDELMEFMDRPQQGDAVDDADGDDPDAEEEDESVPRTKRAGALNAYMQVVRAQARAGASRRALSKNSRPGRIAEWLGERTLAEERRAEVGVSLLVQRSLRRFVNPLRRYVDGLPKRYRPFRRERQRQQTWYAEGGFSWTDLHPLELDLILLAMLRAGRELLARPSVRAETPPWSSLKKFADLRRVQVLVDEATDFSPVQLACMAALAHPRLDSFFACGDFNQRLTTWGTRSAEDLRWVLPNLEIRNVAVAYRQSRQLNDLATAIVRAVGGTPPAVRMPEHVNSEGVPPTLLENARVGTLVPWLASRILEIEGFIGQLPSIAVFVPSEDEVKPLAKELNDALVDHNIQVTACSEGQVIGQEHNVRVFDAQHIKGLEFEAVFFVGVDRLAEAQPDLFDKYLYVGTTRAATYLGLTCDKGLPTAIAGLRSMFSSDWKSA